MYSQLMFDVNLEGALQCKWIYIVSQKVSTVKLYVTLSNLNRFSKFLHPWKSYEICYKTHMTLPI